MKEPTQSHETFDFIDGRSADVSIYQSDKGIMVLVTRDAVNPFNGGNELIECREEIAGKVAERLNTDLRGIRYVEQAGQHFQTVPLERSPEGHIRIPDNTIIMQEPAARVQAMILEHESQQMNPEIALREGWESHLQQPRGHSVDR